MSESPRTGFSLRDVLAQIRRRFPWPPVKPPIVRPGPADPADVNAERLRVQVDEIRRAFEKEGGIGVAGPEGPRRPRDDSDAVYLYRPGHVLVRDGDDFDLLRRFFGDPERAELFDGDLERVGDSPTPGLVVAKMPTRTDGADDVLATLDEVDQAHPERAERGDPIATPDHVLYVTGVPRMCPATEPEEPRRHEPLPPMNPDASAGEDVQISVVDTGLWTDAVTHSTTSSWMDDVSPASPDDIEQVNFAAIHKYAGHGTFVAGIIGCLAPGARIEVEGVLTKAGAVLESEICKQLNHALEDADHPQLISISAGTHTRKDFKLLTFEMLRSTYGLDDGEETLIVAAAGNDKSDQKFYPAAFDWVVAVGAVEADGKVCEFSNYGDWVDVWAHGSKLVNAFPDGTYTCNEPDNIHNGVPDVRHFKGMAQWSGTSFSTPIVTGTVAARMSATKESSRQAFHALVQSAPKSSDPKAGGKPTLGPPFV